MNAHIYDHGNNTEHDNKGLMKTSRRNAGKIGPRLLMDTKGKDYKTINFNLFMKRKKLERTKRSVILTTLRRKSNYITVPNDIMNKSIRIIMAQQMSAKRGIKKFREHAISAIMKEFLQLDQGAVPGKHVVEPSNAMNLSVNEKSKALEAVNIITEKRCGKIKGRTFTDWSKQRCYLKHDESIASSTVSLESLISTLLIIDAYEGRSEGLFDVPGGIFTQKFQKI